MHVILALVVLMVCQAANEIRSRDGAGRVALWRPDATAADRLTEATYDTASLLATDLEEYMKEHATGTAGTVTVVLRTPSTSETSVLALPAVAESMKQATSTRVATAVYGTQRLGVVQSAHKAAGATASTAASSVSPQDAAPALSAAAQEGSSRVLDVLLSASAEDAAALQALHGAAAKVGSQKGRAQPVRVLFVAVDESAGTVPAASAAYMTDGDADMEGVPTTRRLSSSRSSSGQRRNETNTDTAREYRPAGSEFSMYHSSGYLYMTPEILTALLTGFALFAVVLIGLSCTNDISNTADMSFTDEKGIPAIGREA